MAVTGKKLFRRAKSQSLAMERAVLMDMYLKVSTQIQYLKRKKH